MLLRQFHGPFPPVLFVFVIPGRDEVASPESISPQFLRPDGFRGALSRARNDGVCRYAAASSLALNLSSVIRPAVCACASAAAS
ncbi:hypothetical protein, partial [Bradyrhizobium ottawaense]|uniref:hypothetical protein n=1 Tax=Bradyrhizobium ottawaense TaxID=931866 RepID=UPI0030C69DCB